MHQNIRYYNNYDIKIYYNIIYHCRVHDREGALFRTSRRFELSLTPSVKDKKARMNLQSQSRTRSLPNILGQIFEIQSVVDEEPTAALPTHTLSCSNQLPRRRRDVRCHCFDAHSRFCFMHKFAD